MILVFTNKEDSHPTRVIRYLNNWSVPVFRLNTECLLTDYEFHWWCNAQGADFHIKNIKNGLEMYGHEVMAVWDRRPLVPNELFISHEEEEVNKYNLDEAHEFLSFLRYYLKDVFSIGSIVEDRPASSKMLQLDVAQRLGMQIPDTCFANRKEPIANFAGRYGSLSLKAIGDSSVFLGGEEEYVFYSQKAKAMDVVAQPEEAFSQTACFVQEYIEKAYELRLTVIGEDVVACKIDSQAQTDATGKVDWRQGYEHDLKHEIVEVPDNIKVFCRLFLKEMKLHFGCFDFIVTPNGDYVFLECNPNGQWLWIELLTGYDISRMMAVNLVQYENLDLLLNLYAINSQSTHEDEMRRFILEQLKTLNVEVLQDEMGNVFVTKGNNDEYPCVAAHIDEVHPPCKRNLKVVDGMVYALDDEGNQVGIGADDKNGIWVALNLLQTEPVLKVAFFVHEEKFEDQAGCVGSSACDLSFFSNVKYVLECDRKGSSDLVYVGKDVPLCEPCFIPLEIQNRFGYAPVVGGKTDVVELKLRGLEKPCCNISCGYYNAHKNNEFTVLSELHNCLAFVKTFIRL